MLIDGWRETLNKAWSVRLLVLTALFGALEVGLPQFAGLLPEKTFALLSTIAAIGAFACRFIQQPSLKPKDESDDA